MRAAIPAPGYRKTRGDRNPPATDDARYWVQFRNGWLDLHGPYPVKGTRWKHANDDWDIVAVRRA